MRFSLSSSAIAVLSCLLLALPASADQPGPGEENASADAGPVRPWTVDDLLHTESVGSLTLDHDGRLAAWVHNRWHTTGDESERVGHVYLARLGERSGQGADAEPPEPIQLTRGVERPSSLAFSPDSRHLAFLVSREQPGKKKVEGSQVWVLPLEGGEAWAVTSYSRGVRSFAWIDDESLLVSREEDADAREQAIEKKKDTSQAVEDPRDAPPVRLFVVSLDGKSRRLSTNDDRVEQMQVAPDGQRAVITAGQSLSFAFDSEVPPRTFLLDLETGERSEILADSRLLPRSIQWTADSRSFFFVDDYSNHPKYRSATVARLHRFDLAGGGSTRPLELDWPRGLGRGYGVVPGGLVALLADGVRLRPARIAVDGVDATRRDLRGEHARNLDRLVVSRDGSRALYVTSSADRPPQLYTAKLEADGFAHEQRLGHLNPELARRPTGRTEIVRWKGAEGDEVEGVLSFPFDYREGQRHPLILDIHGGPAGVDRDTWDANWASPTPLWRQRGAFVFRVNYHGSSGYGLEWVESIRERYYELEIPDIESGVDMLIAKGLVDPERLATSGWSNGGILSAKLITVTDRYQAAIIGAADVEWISDWANVAFGASFDNYYFGGPPWERLDHYIEKSPFFDLPDVTTPSLVHTGTEDTNVPPHQSWSIFRVMQQVGKADVRLLLYPGEPHGLRQLVHQRRKLEEDLAWFDRYLFGTWTEPAFAVPEGSALATLLARQSARRAELRLAGEARGPAFGVEVDGHLVPEGVEHGELVVGRFEVTRGQWASFLAATADDKPSSQADSWVRDADWPAAGIELSKARAYVDWLRQVTGEPWRLPTVAEAERLARKGGNTLDAWLGYEPNPDDLERVENLLETNEARLLKPVGSHRGTGAPGPGGLGLDDGPAVFDLDGNVAEWALADDGTGQAVGPSAERPAGSDADPSAAYIGLRVVRDRAADG